MESLRKIIKKIFFLIFKIRPLKSYLSFPLKVELYDKLIVIHDESNEKIEKILNEMGFKNYLILREEKENEDLFLESITRKSLVIYLVNSPKNSFLKYLSKDFPVIGVKTNLKVRIPGKDYKSFFENFKKIIAYN